MTKEKIIDFLKKVGAKNIRERSGWVMCSCLFSSEHPKQTDNKPSFGISISNPSYYHCFTCNRKGLLYEIQPLMRKYNLNLDAYDIVRNNESFEFRLVEHTKIQTSGIVPYFQFDKYPKPEKEYLGISVDLYEMWDIREDKDYLFFPIFDKFGRLVEVKIRRKDNKDIFGSRFVYPTEKFYQDIMRINGVGAKQSGVWFGINKADLNEPVFLTEGERDAILLSKYFRNVVASMGASITEAQINSLLEFKSTIILFLDNDDAGNKAKTKIIKKIEHKEVYQVTDYYGLKDPAEIIEKGILRRVIKSIKKL